MSSPPQFERVLEGHAWGSGGGPEQYGPRHHYRESLMLRRLARMGPHGNLVLNAGCGAGSLTLRLLDHGFDVFSMDASESFVSAVADLLRDRGIDPDERAITSDICALDYDDGSFDSVVCGEVLEHVSDDAKALRELARVLRPGGCLVATVPANPWRYDWLDRWAGHERRYTPDGLTAVVTRAGFVNVEVLGWGFPVTGAYHRVVYRRLMRWQISRGAGEGILSSQHPESSLPRRALMRAIRAVFEIDSLFLGRRPGYFGLLVSARRAS